MKEVGKMHVQAVCITDIYIHAHY